MSTSSELRASTHLKGELNIRVGPNFKNMEFATQQYCEAKISMVCKLDIFDLSDLKFGM